MKKHFIVFDHSVYTVIGESGKEYYFDYIPFNRKNFEDKINRIRGFGIYMFIKNIENPKPLLIDIGHRLFSNETFDMFSRYDFILRNNPDIFFYTQDYLKSDCLFIITDLLNGNSFNLDIYNAFPSDISFQ